MSKTRTRIMRSIAAGALVVGAGLVASPASAFPGLDFDPPVLPDLCWDGVGLVPCDEIPAGEDPGGWEVPPWDGVGEPGTEPGDEPTDEPTDPTVPGDEPSDEPSGDQPVETVDVDDAPAAQAVSGSPTFTG